MSFGIDASGFTRLAADLREVSAEAVPGIRPVFQAAADELKAKWKANARATAGKHGKLYPNAITYETRLTAGGIYAEIGPDSSMPQGGMSFEFGSVNQPPHLDGQKAADAVVPALGLKVDAAVSKVLGAADL